MAENSAISWTRHTWNPVIGCAKVSPACDGCYAEALMDKRYHKVEWGAPGHGAGTRVRTKPATWNDPFRWQRQAEADGDRPFVFCASLADVFDNQWEPEWRAEAFDVMRRTPNLVYLLLTKRPQLIGKLAKEAGGLPANAAIGTTSEDQPRADSNLLALQKARDLVSPLFTFGSFEPLLGLIKVLPGLMPDWVITGGETDQGTHKARPSHPAWFRSLRDQCAAAGVPYHHKQNGEWVAVTDGLINFVEDAILWPDGTIGPGSASQNGGGGYHMRKVGKRKSGRLLDGVEHNAFPQIGVAA